MSEENKAVVRRYIEKVWNWHNIDAADELVSPDYLNHVASAEYRCGIPAVKHVLNWLFTVFPDHRLDIEARHHGRGHGGDTGHLQRYPRGRTVGHPADGRGFRRPAVSLVSRLRWQGGGALGGQGRARHDAPAGDCACLTGRISSRQKKDY